MKTCKTCGFKNPPSFKNCVKCQASLEKPAPPVKAAPAKKPAPAAAKAPERMLGQEGVANVAPAVVLPAVVTHMEVHPDPVVTKIAPSGQYGYGMPIIAPAGKCPVVFSNDAQKWAAEVGKHAPPGYFYTTAALRYWLRQQMVEQKTFSEDSFAAFCELLPGASDYKANRLGIGA